MRSKLQILVAWLKLQYGRWRYGAGLAHLREKRWRALLQKIDSSPFYGPLIEKGTPFDEYPIMNKQKFMDNFDGINTENIKHVEALQVATRAENTRDFAPTINGITVGLSSGTSGNAGIFLASQREHAQWVAAVLDRVIGLSLKPRSVAFFLRANSNLYSAVRSRLLRFEFFDLMDPLSEQVPRLNELDPTILVGQPSLLLKLASKVEIGELSISPSKIISVAEVLYPEDSAYLEAVFGRTIHQVYQCTEGFLASTCSQGTLHFNEDFLIIEKKYLDEERSRFHPIITDLLRSTQPVIRYELNDIIVEKKDCGCGSKFTGIDHIEGRSDDMLTFENDHGKAVSIFPDFFRRAIVLADSSIRNYSLVQSGKREILLYLDGTENVFASCRAALLDLLKQHGISNVLIHRAENLEHKLGEKLRRIRNDFSYDHR